MRERSPGVWQFRVSAPPHPITGEARTVVATFRGNKKAASAALAELVTTTRRAGPAAAGTLGELLDAWLEVAPINDITRRTYDSALKHLPTGWRERKADTIRATDISMLYRYLTDHAVGAATVRKLHTVLSGAFTQGIRWEALQRNPCTRAALPPLKRNTRIPTDAELGLLFAAATDQEVVLLSVAIAAGGRRGEMVALRWEHLELDAGRIRIVDSLDQLGRTTDTKTGRDDMLPIDADVVAVLKAWRLAQVERALAVGVSFSPRGYVLSDADDAGRPWSVSTATHRFIALRKRAKVSGVRLHDMRHVTATKLLNAGVDLATVSKHMRHSRVSTTADVYAHVIAGQDQRVAGILGGVVRKAGSSTG